MELHISIRSSVNPRIPSSTEIEQTKSNFIYPISRKQTNTFSFSFLYLVHNNGSLMSIFLSSSPSDPPKYETILRTEFLYSTASFHARTLVIFLTHTVTGELSVGRGWSTTKGPSVFFPLRSTHYSLEMSVHFE